MSVESNQLATPAAKPNLSRLTTIDVTRGLVMVIMALDHVRDLLHLPAMTSDPTDLTTTSVPLFLTRWITHLCAPTFVFLSGTSAYLMLRRRTLAGQPVSTGRQFLRNRGFVLIALELTVINFAFWFEIPFHSLLLQVIWAIGGGFVFLSLLSRLSPRLLGLAGLLILFGHNVLSASLTPTDIISRLVTALLLRVDLFSFPPALTVLVAYPLLPWLGMMLVGYALGPLFEQPLLLRQRYLALLGLATLTLFVALRFLNGYGDPAAWSVQKTIVFTFLSFLNVSKYPPSLLYSLLMLGLAFLILALADGRPGRFVRILTVYGRVPMFYYLVHWYLIHFMMIGVAALQGFSPWNPAPAPLSFGRPEGMGVSLALVYLAWICLVVALYPICRWYGSYKLNHPEKRWLKYL